MCGPCLCAPPTRLCSGSLVRSIPPTTKRVREGTKVLRLINTFVRDIALNHFPNLERLVERHNPILQCKSLHSQLASLPRTISVASDCLDQNSSRQSLAEIATTPGVGGRTTPTKAVFDPPPTLLGNPPKQAHLSSGTPSFWALVAIGIILIIAFLLWLGTKIRAACRRNLGDREQTFNPLIDLSSPRGSLVDPSVLETPDNSDTNTTQDDTVIMIHLPPRNPPREHSISETDSPIDSQPASPPPAEISSSAGSGVLRNVIDLPEHGSHTCARRPRQHQQPAPACRWGTSARCRLWKAAVLQ